MLGYRSDNQWRVKWFPQQNPSNPDRFTPSRRLTAVNRNHLTNFSGEVHLISVRNGQHLHAAGSVTRTADSVRFYQKDLALQDRDIRVWTITELEDSTFSAAPYAAC